MAPTSSLIRYTHAAGITGLTAAACYALDPPSRWLCVPLLGMASAVAAWRTGSGPALAATLAAAAGLTQIPVGVPGWGAALPGGYAAAAGYLVLVLPFFAVQAAVRRALRRERTVRRELEREIAGQRELTVAWRTRHEQLAEALRAAGLWAWSWDFQSGFVTVTAHAEPLGGRGGLTLPRAQLHAEACLERVHPEDRAALQRALDEALAQRVSRAVECRIYTGRRSTIWVQAHGHVMCDESGAPIRACGVLQSIDERKRAEETRLENDRRKDQFLAIVGHELRNPLNPMSAALEVLREKEEDAGMRAWARVLIERQVRHLARLLDDLLDVSRLAHGKFALRREAVDICGLIGATIDSVRADIDGKKQRVEFHVGRLEPLYVDGDAVRLTQIVSNLVTNAMKYSPSGSTITVAVEAAEDEIEIIVSDTGIGIPREDLERVFDLFAQSSTGSKFSGNGLGIGLYLVRGLVEMHGGAISAHSAGVGHGSSFRVTLPRVHAPRAPAEEGRLSDCEERARGPLRVVVADDNADSVDTLSVLLRMQGHEVRTASHGGEAAELIAAYRPDVAVLDIGMPVLNGYEVARRVRAQVPHAVLIALSGWGNAEDVARAKEAGFDHHVAKPADFARLERLIGRARAAAGAAARGADPVALPRDA